MKAMQLQEQHPLFSETAICGLLRVGSEYIADRSKHSPMVKETRDVMSAMRQGAWEQKGIELIDRPGQSTNPVVYIWMTRNMLGWRNDPVLIESDTKRPAGITLNYSLNDKEKKPL